MRPSPPGIKIIRALESFPCQYIVRDGLELHKKHFSIGCIGMICACMCVAISKSRIKFFFMIGLVTSIRSFISVISIGVVELKLCFPLCFIILA